MNPERFYVTTPIYYVNDKPHLGTAYSTIMADVLARYHRLFGNETLFLTGVDEHGQKIQQAAEKRGKTPQEHCDELSENFKEIWKKLDIQYDIFFRTTSDFHVAAVQKALQDLYGKGDIYADVYEGWYCVSEEIFYTEKELVDGKTPTGKDVTRITEKNYFFRMSKYQQALIDYINSHPNFIRPQNRKNEVLGFLRQPLGDLCISRPKSRLSWGIEIPFDSNYVTYVWFDALLNYATAVGLNQPARAEEFKKWWGSPVHHLIGKDILTTHCVYWTTMLMAMNLPLPQTIFAHGWILNRDNEKMSKSKGSVMDPDELIRFAGVDSLRYFLVREIHFGNDAPISHELIMNRINNDLSNNLGNLLSRTTTLIDKFFGGIAPHHQEIAAADAESVALINHATQLSGQVKTLIEKFQPAQALEQIVLLLDDTNRFLEAKAPWKTAKTDLAAAGQHLYVAVEILRITGVLLSPIMPTKCRDLLQSIGVTNTPSWESLSQWGVTPPDAHIAKAPPLFPRIEI